ncbi:DNA-binding transcriptional regulator, LysR family [Dyella sp. OK004]|uniref:LysR family transcriptional regulator n=1 Tax=Dyella sp. OK004 TaxID=1855292 RepID=UPI0008F113AE|nr:LysR family transcriptional regulator [Dyella sp. OK004]SFR88470.1 DNA-binding transcriptional regulator, LysR family [Dyella sp. OK004]
MDFDPSLLRAFVAVKETGGFTRAAQRLNLTQSAISHQIRRLEEQVGRQLLFRTTRAMTLTEDGEDFLHYAEKILHTLDSMAQRFKPSPISGVVRFGVLENFLGDRLPTLLCQYGRAFPSVRLDVSVGMNLDLQPMIKAGELDLAVVMAAPGSEEGTPLRRTQFVWAAAESFDMAPGASLPCALFPSPCLNRLVGQGALDGKGMPWHVVFTSQSYQGIRAAVLAGLAVTVMTREDVEPGMKIIDGNYGLPALSEAEFILVWGAGGKTPAAVEFGKLITQMPGVDGATRK